MNKIRVLVVDDSFFMRKAIQKMLSVDDIEVVGTAENGQEAIIKNRELKPDVITLDIEMPVMNGLEAVGTITKESNVPVLMLSTLTAEGADSTIKALSNGATDFITKKTGFNEVNSMQEELLSKVRYLANSSLARNLSKRRNILRQNQEIAPEQELKPTKLREFKINFDFTKVRILLIGISTGGPMALQQVIPHLSKDFPVPIIIVQHMPPKFTKSLADRLDSMSKLKVKEAEDFDKLVKGTVYLGPGGKQMVTLSSKEIRITDKPEDSLYKPSVDITGLTVNKSFKGDVLGLMMTGMGSDGSLAFQELSNSGAFIMCQSEDTCVVSGMVNAVIQKGIARKIVPLDEIANNLNKFFNL